MILTFALVKPETVRDERLFALVAKMRRIAIEIDGVYDLALYQIKNERVDLWQCSLDVEDEEAWQLAQADLRFQQAWEEARALGVRIVQESRLERRV